MSPDCPQEPIRVRTALSIWTHYFCSCNPSKWLLRLIFYGSCGCWKASLSYTTNASDLSSDAFHMDTTIRSWTDCFLTKEGNRKIGHRDKSLDSAPKQRAPIPSFALVLTLAAVSNGKDLLSKSLSKLHFRNQIRMGHQWSLVEPWPLHMWEQCIQRPTELTHATEPTRKRDWASFLSSDLLRPFPNGPKDQLASVQGTSFLLHQSEAATVLLATAWGQKLSSCGDGSVGRSTCFPGVKTWVWTPAPYLKARHAG